MCKPWADGCMLLWPMAVRFSARSAVYEPHSLASELFNRHEQSVNGHYESMSTDKVDCALAKAVAHRASTAAWLPRFMPDSRSKEVQLRSRSRATLASTMASQQDSKPAFSVSNTTGVTCPAAQVSTLLGYAVLCYTLHGEASGQVGNGQATGKAKLNKPHQSR